LRHIQHCCHVRLGQLLGFAVFFEGHSLQFFAYTLFVIRHVGGVHLCLKFLVIPWHTVIRFRGLSSAGRRLRPPAAHFPDSCKRLAVKSTLFCSVAVRPSHHSPNSSENSTFQNMPWTTLCRQRHGNIWVRDMKVDIALSVWKRAVLRAYGVRMGGAPVGQVVNLRPIGNRPGRPGAQTAGRRVANPPQDAILPHVRTATSTLLCVAHAGHSSHSAQKIEIAAQVRLGYVVQKQPSISALIMRLRRLELLQPRRYLILGHA
jgi:hypothetical protein